MPDQEANQCLTFELVLLGVIFLAPVQRPPTHWGRLEQRSVRLMPSCRGETIPLSDQRRSPQAGRAASRRRRERGDVQSISRRRFCRGCALPAPRIRYRSQPLRHVEGRSALRFLVHEQVLSLIHI